MKKRMIKKIKNIAERTVLLLFAAFIVISCDNDYEEPQPFTDLTLTFSSGSASERKSAVNQFFSFSDVSAGVRYREWTIPENAFFLGGPIPNNLERHDDFIINPGVKMSNDKTVHVLWTQGDTATQVSYYGEFDDSTGFIFPAYFDFDIAATVYDTVSTVLDSASLSQGEELWIAEYTFLVDVYDTVSAVPQIMYPDSTVIDLASTPEITIEFEDSLLFEDLSAFIPENTSRPEHTRWRLFVAGEDPADRSYNTIGSEDRSGDLEKRIIMSHTFTRVGRFQAELLARRDRDDNLRANEHTLEVPLIINVVQKSEPLTVDGNVTEFADNTIELTLSDKLVVAGSNLIGNFTVKVDGVSVPISSITLSPDSNKKLWIMLDVPLEPSDASKSVTLSYDGASKSLFTGDIRPLQPFTDVPIDVYVPSPISLDGSIAELESQTLQIPFDDDFSPESLTGQEGFFTVSIVNGAYASTPTVSSIGLAADASIIEITLDETIYSDDQITVSLSDGSSILGIGAGTPVPFDDQPVTMYDHIVFEEDFEGASAANWENRNPAHATMGLSTEQAVSGSNSWKVTVTTGNQFVVEDNRTDMFTLPQGVSLTYEYKFLKVDDTFDNVGPWIRNSDNTSFTQYGAKNQDFINAPTGTWITNTAPKVFPTTSDGASYYAYLRHRVSAGQTGTVYIDDIRIWIIDERP
ncbi:MAG: hypothetical protein AAGA66_19540 [Bacteroidota bacterium]